MACSILVPWSGDEPSLQWKCGVLSTGPPGIPLVLSGLLEGEHLLCPFPPLPCHAWPAPRLGFSPAISSHRSALAEKELQVSLCLTENLWHRGWQWWSSNQTPAKMDITGLSGSSYLLQPVSACLPAPLPLPVIQEPPPPTLQDPWLSCPPPILSVYILFLMNVTRAAWVSKWVSPLARDLHLISHASPLALPSGETSQKACSLW